MSLTLENDRHWCEKYKDFQENFVTIKVNDVKESVYVGNCEKGVVQIQGKAKSLTINSCKEVGVVFDSTVGNVELVNCKKVQVQCTDSAPLFQLDNCERCTLFLTRANAEKVQIFSSKIDACNITVPTPDDEDQIEIPIPEQIASKWEAGAGTFTHSVRTATE